MEQAVVEARAGHLDVVGELEAAFEGARGDAAVKDLAAVLLLLFLLLALHGEDVLLRLDVDVALAEAGDGHRHPVGVLAGALDIVRGIRLCLAVRHRIEQTEETVEADGGAIERAEIISTHFLSSLKRHSRRDGAWSPDRGGTCRPAGPFGIRKDKIGSRF